MPQHLERRGREREPRIEDDDPGHHQQQHTRYQKGCEYLHAARVERSTARREPIGSL